MPDQAISLMAHLLRRAGYGASRDEIEAKVALGYDSVVDDLLNPGDDPGIAAEVPAGSIVVFSSTLFHRSGMNSTAQQRRVYLPQYSSEPIMNKEGTDFWGFADAFVKNGERVKSVLV